MAHQNSNHVKFMPDVFMSIKEASELSGKSVQTLRRAIKSRRIKSKRQRTPQGYNYLVHQGSIIGYYRLKEKLFDREQKGLNEDPTSRLTSQLNNRNSKKYSNKLFVFTEKKYITPGDLANFNKAFKDFVRQSHREKEELLCLIKAFQERMIVLENQVKLLEAGTQKKWYEFWK